MKVENIPVIYNTKRLEKDINTPKTSAPSYDNNQLTRLSGCEIPFCAIQGIKPVKNVIDKKMQILQKIEAMLNERQKYDRDRVFQEVQARHSKEMGNFISRLLKTHYSKNALLETFGARIPTESEVRNLTVSLLYRNIDEFLAIIEKMAKETDELVQKRALADNTNYELLGRLHSTLIRDDLNLTGTYKSFYEKLNSMTKLSEVSKTYPRIKLPPSPGYVAGKKIVNTFPKDFFIKYDELVSQGEKNEASQLFADAFENMIKMISQDSKVDVEFLRHKLFKGTKKAFLSAYYDLKRSHGFASYPGQKKIKRPIIGQGDIDMLSLDYDRFVLHVLREQYIAGKNLSQIKYTEGGRTVTPASIPKEYKFEKPDEKIKSLLRMSETLKKEETDYERFGNEQFRSKLKHLFNHEYANSEILLDRLIAFDSAQFVEGDRIPLIKFLRVMDDLCDGKISVEEAEKIVEKENLRPLGTDLINSAEKEKNLKQLKEEQKKLNEFNKYCKKFDNAIAALFNENLEEAAVLCISYKPKSVKDSTLISDKILNLIEEYMQNGKIQEPAKLDKTIKNVHAYFHCKEFYPDKPLLKMAEKYAKNADGEINEAKAGQYLNCAELAAKYPSSSAYFSNNDKMIFSTIMEKSPDNESAVLNLIKFENYNILTPKEKGQISTILKSFDINSDTDKEIIESIMRNNYIKNPTYINTSLNKEGTVVTESQMTPGAKEAILADKQYPACIKYFEAFEKSMTRVGQAKEEDAIQIIGSNNKKLRKLYKQEVKIAMDERLYSTQGNYVFDVYKPGLHKLKNTKA